MNIKPALVPEDLVFMNGKSGKSAAKQRNGKQETTMT
jgi:hypothetical protein